MVSPDTDGFGVVAVQCAGGKVALGYPADEKSRHGHIPFIRHHRLPGAMTRTQAFCTIPITRAHFNASLNHSGSSTQRFAGRKSIKFCDILLLWIGLIAGFTTLYIIIMAMMYHCHDLHPTFRVRDLAVSNFSTLDHGPAGRAATWEVNLTMISSHGKHAIFVPQFIQHFFDCYIGSIIEPLFPRTREPLLLRERSIASTVAMTNAISSLWENIRLKLRDDKTVTLRLGLGIHLKDSSRKVATIYCPGLSVKFGFVGDAGNEVSCWTSFTPYYERSQGLPYVEVDSLFLFGEMGAEA